MLALYSNIIVAKLSNPETNKEILGYLKKTQKIEIM
jgi:hypothetical protein